MFLTITFYHFVNLENIERIREHINKFCQDNKIKGNKRIIDGSFNLLNLDIEKFIFPWKT